MTTTERQRRARKRRHTVIATAVIAATITACADQPAPKPSATAGQLTDRDVVKLRALDPTPAPTKTPAAKPRVKPQRSRHARIGTAVHITIPNVWLRLADCESGEWDRHRHPIPGSRRWDYNDGHYFGAFNFAASTYSSHKPHGYPSRADLASPSQQYVVARLVLRDQGVRAWPICGPKVGLTMQDAA